MRPKGSWLGRRFRVLPRRYWLPAMFAGILTSHALFVLSFKYRNADRVRRKLKDNDIGDVNVK